MCEGGGGWPPPTVGTFGISGIKKTAVLMHSRVKLSTTKNKKIFQNFKIRGSAEKSHA